MRRFPFAIAPLILSVIGMTPVLGQSEATVPAAAMPADTSSDDAFRVTTPWTIRIEPMLWYPGLRGDISFAGGGDSDFNKIDVEDIDLDENELTFGVSADIRAEPWSFHFEGFLFSADDDGVAERALNAGPLPIPAGTPLDFDLDFGAFEATVGHRIYESVFDRADGDDVALIFDAYGGIRMYDVDLTLETAGGTVRNDDEWLEPILGVRMTMLLPKGFGIDLNTDFGAWGGNDRSSSSWNIEVGMHWAPHDHVELQIGFRHLSVDLREGSGDFDEFIFDNSLAGLYGGIVIRF